MRPTKFFAAAEAELSNRGLAPDGLDEMGPSVYRSCGNVTIKGETRLRTFGEQTLVQGRGYVCLAVQNQRVVGMHASYSVISLPSDGS